VDRARPLGPTIGVSSYEVSHVSHARNASATRRAVPEWTRTRNPGPSLRATVSLGRRNQRGHIGVARGGSTGPRGLKAVVEQRMLSELRWHPAGLKGPGSALRRYPAFSGHRGESWTKQRAGACEFHSDYSQHSSARTAWPKPRECWPWARGRFHHAEPRQAHRPCPHRASMPLRRHAMDDR
jgi:hypothetical protein